MLNGALPDWDIDAVRLVLAFARTLWLAALLSSAGALLFRAREPRLPAHVTMQLDVLIRSSLAAAGLAWVAWAVLQALVLAGPDPAAMLPALWTTSFGRCALAQAALLALARLLLPGPLALPVLPALAAVVLQASHLHAFAMEATPGLLTASGTLHLLAAAAWLGSLLPLRLVVRHAGAEEAAAVTLRFSGRASGFVLVLAATAFVQGRTLLGGLPGIAGTAYGWMAIAKALLFALLLALAAQHRWGLLPRLAGGRAWAAQRALARSVLVETGAGLLLVTAAALLSALPPGMHARPVWPFALQPSLAAVQDDAGFAREAALGAAGVLAGLLLAVAALAWRRLRWPGLALATLLLGLAAPHMSLLLVPAYPTSFYHSPTGFDAAGIAEGAALYPAHCARCHGEAGRGDGPDAARLPVPPADLTAPHLWAHADGELFWWLAKGMAAPDGTPAMPGFATTLDETARWQLIDYIRARNAGLARAATGAWPVPLAAPDLAAACGGQERTLIELRGHPVRLVFQGRDDTPPPPLPGAIAILIPRPGATEASGGDCIADDPAIRAAYAVVTGLDATALVSVSVLIDANGWLRAVLPDSAAAQLAGSLLTIAAAPLPASPAMMHHPM